MLGRGKGEVGSYAIFAELGRVEGEGGSFVSLLCWGEVREGVMYISCVWER